MSDHPCAIECQRRVHKGYPKCVDANQCDHGPMPEESIADLIPKWYEGGTPEQMLDEAYAQIRRLEAHQWEEQDMNMLCALLLYFGLYLAQYNIVEAINKLPQAQQCEAKK